MERRKFFKFLTAGAALIPFIKKQESDNSNSQDEFNQYNNGVFTVQKTGHYLTQCHRYR